MADRAHFWRIGLLGVNGFENFDPWKGWRIGMNRFAARLFYGILLSMAHSTLLLAQTDASPKITYGAFLDAHYAYDFEHPTTRDRAYTTQPARHNEFNINLAFKDRIYPTHDSAKLSDRNGLLVTSLALTL